MCVCEWKKDDSHELFYLSIFIQNRLFWELFYQLSNINSEYTWNSAWPFFKRLTQWYSHFLDETWCKDLPCLSWIPGLSRNFFIQAIFNISILEVIQWFIFWSIRKVCPGMSTYAHAYAKVWKWIFHVWLPGNEFGFGIVSNDFWSSTIWAIELQASFAEFKNPKNPGIQPNHWSFEW